MVHLTIMQTLKLRSVLNVTTLSKQWVRRVAVNASQFKEEEESIPLKSWKEIPGPSSLPLIGQMRHFLPGGSLYNITGEEFTNKLYKTYGPIIRFEALMGRSAMIFLFDPESSAQVLRGENWLPIRPGFKSLDYYKKVYNKTDNDASKPTGLLTDHGENWREFRSTVNPVLLQPKTVKLYSTVLDEIAQDMVTRIRSKRDEKNMISEDFDIDMNLWALESVGVIALGGRLDCFNPSLSEDSPARKLIKNVHDFFIIANELDFKLSFWKYISTPTFKKGMTIYEDQENLAKFFVNNAKENLKTNIKKSEDEKGVLEKLLDINEDIAHIMACDMLTAGVDTTAHSMLGTFYLLAKNPEKQEKLREEIKLKPEKRPYLKACLKESIRMMPVAAGNMRTVTKDYSILGYKIPKDMQVVFAHQYMATMDSQYTRPLEFVPERWLVDKTDPLYHGKAHPFASNPFGFGARSCIGRRIAELEMETLLARVIENFNIEWVGPPPQTSSNSLNYIKGPFNFVFKDV